MLEYRFFSGKSRGFIKRLEKLNREEGWEAVGFSYTITGDENIVLLKREKPEPDNTN